MRLTTIARTLAVQNLFVLVTIFFGLWYGKLYYVICKQSPLKKTWCNWIYGLHLTCCSLKWHCILHSSIGSNIQEPLEVFSHITTDLNLTWEKTQLCAFQTLTKRATYCSNRKKRLASQSEKGKLIHQCITGKISIQIWATRSALCTSPLYLIDWPESLYRWFHRSEPDSLRLKTMKTSSAADLKDWIPLHYKPMFLIYPGSTPYPICHFDYCCSCHFYCLHYHNKRNSKWFIGILQ